MTASNQNVKFDPVQLAVMANRIDAIVREMTSTVVLTACSSVIGMARDFSCAILTADHELLSAADGLPVHTFGGSLQGKHLEKAHPDLREGDAFLNNDPYSGNSHPADHTFLVPVFHEGKHVFTTAVKCHQADCGNSLPTTYHASARDIYEEGALIFPMVKVQSDYQDNSDIVRMCRSRIRVPDQWHGDFLSGISAARAGERALKGFVEQFGWKQVQAFNEAWLDYSERRALAAIKEMPKAVVQRSGRIDPLEDFLPEGLDVNATVHVEPEEGLITIDLRDNVDCLDNGLNQTEATVTAMAITGVINCLGGDLPLNSGTFRRIKVQLRENCAVGLPEFPHSCSVATTMIADTLGNIVQHALTDLGYGYGIAEGNLCLPASTAVISGKDFRKADADYVNQLFLMGGGGPASASGDGINYYIVPGGAGVCYRDSVEIDEQRLPIIVHSMGLVAGSAGAGMRRGGLATRVEFGPRGDGLTVMALTNGSQTAPRGAHGGLAAFPGANLRLKAGEITDTLGGYIVETLAGDETLVSFDSGGGGYGDPTTRSPELVLEDVLERYETPERARDIYKVALIYDEFGDAVAVDKQATERARAGF
ncbi:hydantoinase B/oxoprolinase family protein [Pseudomonas gozinkensis]|uniref:hydantoinase B/oxoprolinase family protein n=1 Tax=Pseudomonas gozinkensis TaxID=2774461 RepID=UPI0017887856|nr:hydantoinase B/oxoprolinase family protein [Pseudomonas gozinkensis]